MHATDIYVKSISGAGSERLMPSAIASHIVVQRGIYRHTGRIRWSIPILMYTCTEELRSARFVSG